MSCYIAYDLNTDTLCFHGQVLRAKGSRFVSCRADSYLGNRTYSHIPGVNTDRPISISPHGSCSNSRTVNSLNDNYAYNIPAIKPPKKPSSSDLNPISPPTSKRQKAALPTDACSRRSSLLLGVKLPPVVQLIRRILLCEQTPMFHPLHSVVFQHSAVSVEYSHSGMLFWRADAAEQSEQLTSRRLARLRLLPRPSLLVLLPQLPGVSLVRYQARILTIV